MISSQHSRSFVILAVAASWSFSAFAHAGLTFGAIGGTVDANSWKQPFQISSTQSFEHVGLVMTPFDALSGFKTPAWDFSLGNPDSFVGGAVYPAIFGMQWTVASGTATNDLVWLSHFQGDETQQNFLLTLFAFDDSFNVEVATAFWDGISWDFAGHTPGINWDEFVAAGGIAGIDTTNVPLPPAALLGLFGLGLVGVVRRRFAQ